MHIMQEKKKNNQNVILLDLKITDWVTNAKNMKKHGSQQMKQLKFFPDLYWFYNGDLDNFLLLLGKGVYPYECMNSWGKFDETSIPPEKAFYSELNEEGISDADYACVEKVWEIFKIKNLGIMICMLNAAHYCLQMFLKILEISVIKYMDLIPLIFCLRQD